MILSSFSWIDGSAITSGGYKSLVNVEADGVVIDSVVMRGAVIEAGAVVGAAPDGSEGWGVATCGPNVHVKPGETIPAAAMVYSEEEV